MASPSVEPSTSAATESTPTEWGRVVIVGGTDWPTLGKKVDTPNRSPDLASPHVFRPLANVRIVSVHSGHSACHHVCIDDTGAAYLFGRNATSQLGAPIAQYPQEVPSVAPKRLHPAELGLGNDVKWVDAAIGRGHTVLVASNGSAWSAGANNMGQTGHPVHGKTVASFKCIQGPFTGKEEDPVVAAAAGLTFSLILTKSGKVYAFGSSEKGQLGNGKHGERIITGGKTDFDVESTPIIVKGIADKKIVQIACGQQHALALDDSGYVYGWGFNGYSRLGLGHQKDQLVPALIPGFSSNNAILRAKMIACGPTSSAVVNNQGMYWLAGKWKTTGDGSGGQPWTTFKYVQDISGCKVWGISSGGVTHFALADDDVPESTLTIGWGQNANNAELAVGEGKPKSATKPMKIETLDGVRVTSVAAGQNTTLFLVKPSDKVSDMPRFPELQADPSEVCVACQQGGSPDETTLECERCESPYHIKCLNPSVESVPEGEWFCKPCEDGVAAQAAASLPNSTDGADGEDGAEAAPAPKKRGRPKKDTAGSAPAPKKRK